MRVADDVRRFEREPKRKEIQHSQLVRVQWFSIAIKLFGNVSRVDSGTIHSISLAFVQARARAHVKWGTWARAAKCTHKHMCQPNGVYVCRFWKSRIDSGIWSIVPSNWIHNIMCKHQWHFPSWSLYSPIFRVTHNRYGQHPEWLQPFLVAAALTARF